MTEKEVLDLLRARHVRPGNGGAGEYAFMTHVRNSAGFNSTRTFDAVVMSLWPSRGLMLHAFEVKCSRGDWLRELKEPAKAEAAAKLVDRFSVVAANDKIVAEGELPPTWGLLVVKGSKLVCVKDAPLLPTADPSRPVSRAFLVAMLRASGAVPVADAEEVRLARLEARREAMELYDQQSKAQLETYQALLKKVAEFERESGISLQWGHRGKTLAEVGAAVRVVLDGEGHEKQARRKIEVARDQLRTAADQLDRCLS